jgi:hypothetical protein
MRTCENYDFLFKLYIVLSRYRTIFYYIFVMADESHKHTTFAEWGFQDVRVETQ